MGPDQFEHLDYAADEGVAVVTLNRPERRNAWMNAALTGSDFRIGLAAAKAKQRPDFLAARAD